jgi:nitrogen fixation protein NifU and related proteins
MADLSDLYQQIIVEHNRAPRNFKKLDDANRTAHGYNPLCGDKIELFVRVDGDRIADIGFQGKGCAISQASASLMTGAVKGKTVAEADALFQQFHGMVMSPPDVPADASLGKLAAFAGVRQFPSRVKCANLSWHTLHAALAQTEVPVSTE